MLHVRFKLCAFSYESRYFDAQSGKEVVARVSLVNWSLLTFPFSFSEFLHSLMYHCRPCPQVGQQFSSF